MIRFGRPTVTSALATLLVALIGVVRPGIAESALDLVPDVFDVSVQVDDVGQDEVTEGCAGGTTARRLVRFALRIRNLGPDDLLVGEPMCPECPTNPGAICSNPLFFCSPAHGHAHFRSFVRAALLDQQGAVVAEGEKFGFCLVDSECAQPQFTDCGYQGISAGCGDVYVAGLGCQYVDVTDAYVPGGTYTLRVTIDPLDVLAESDEANNVTDVPVELCGESPACPVYPATDVPQALPDLDTTVSAVDIPVGGPLSSVAVVGLRGTHTFMSDLEFRLRAPSGTEVVVMDRVCGVDDDFQLALDDTACDGLSCPPTDGLPHRPSQPLAPFRGESAAGRWTLRVTDLAADDVGTLDGWGLRVCSCGDGSQAPGEECDDGNTTDGDGCSATCRREACGPTPFEGCRRPTLGERSQLVLRDEADDARDTLLWKWLPGSTAKSDFGEPQLGTDYQLCLYRGSTPRLFSSVTVPDAASCGSPPCWSESPTGFVFRDPDQVSPPFRRIVLRGGAKPGRAKVVIEGKGAALGLAPLGTLTSPLTVQLVNRETGTCWESVYSFPPAQRQDDTRFSDRGDP